jgi:maleylpyruvate isomerase
MNTPRPNDAIKKPDLHLYEYFRSTASYRIRIALNLKGLRYESIPVHLSKGGGEQFTEAFRGRNPQALVPVLEVGAVSLSQSLAILEFLEEQYKTAPLLPESAEARGYVRQISLAIACDIHPINNLRVLKYLSEVIEVTDDERNAWISHWVGLGLKALEASIVSSKLRGRFCYGDQPTLADCCLVPQLFNARRFKIDLTHVPNLCEIDAACQSLDAFERAHPLRQPDAE